MVLKCLVCDLPLQKMDAALICPNGHIIQNTIVEKEKMECEVVGKKKRIYKLRQKIKKAYHRELLVEGEELLLSLYKLFVEAKSYFEFTTDRFFKFMCGTWRYKDGHQNVVKDSIEIIKDVLVNKNYTMYADYSLYMNYQKEVLGICNVDYTSYVNKGNYLDRNTRANINDFVTIVYLSKTVVGAAACGIPAGGPDPAAGGRFPAAAYRYMAWGSFNTRYKAVTMRGTIVWITQSCSVTWNATVRWPFHWE